MEAEPDHTWEYVKENVRPVRTGRHVKDIAAFAAVTTTHETTITGDGAEMEGTETEKDKDATKRWIASGGRSGIKNMKF